MLEVAVRKRLASFELDVEFELPTPGVAALFGPSGCGKSTTVNLIAGLLAPDAGRISLGDDCLIDTGQRRALPAERRRIGYVFQDARLFPHLSVAGNLRYALTRARGPRFVSFEDVVTLLELAPLLGRRTHRLSGGERQRVAIGRALLSQPRLLLLDEPLASLDRERREEVLPYLESLRDRLGVPMVYVSHQFDEVLRLATHIVLIEAGRVTAQGSIGAVSLDRRLRALIGPESVGAVIEGRALGVDAASGLARIAVGRGELKMPGSSLPVGAAVRIQLLARDIIVATERTARLSVRNQLEGVITGIERDDEYSDLVSIDVGGPAVLARVTREATRELALAPGTPVWALIKAASLRGSAARARMSQDA